MRVSGFGDTQKEILVALKNEGGGTVRELAEALDVSPETVRAHLKALAAKGVVRRTGKRTEGPGRPEIVHGLTPEAGRLFPNHGGELLKGLASHLLKTGNDDILRTFLAGFIDTHRAHALARVQGLRGRERLEEVAAILAEMGFMARVEDRGAEGPAIRLSHCPLRDLLDVTDLPCRLERDFVGELMGERPDRVRHMLVGDASCTYTPSR